MSQRSLFHEWYDVLFDSKAYSSEVATALSLAATHLSAAPSRVLEVGCGTGNHTLELARQVADVVAIDIDETMVALAGEKLAASNATATVLKSSCEELQERDFDAAFALFNVVNYVPTTDALVSLFGAIADRLRNPGFFLFDSWNGVAALRDPPRAKRVEVEHEGAKVACDLSAETDPMLQRTILTYQIRVTEGETQREDAFSFSQTLLTPMQIRDALRRANIELMACTRLFDPNTTATEDDWKLMWSCQIGSS